jgi:hypothetical protein
MVNEIRFETPTLADCCRAKELLALSGFQGCEYAFGCNYIWRNFYDIKIAFLGEFYIIRNAMGYCFPAGRGTDTELRMAIDCLRLDYANNPNKADEFIFSSMDDYGRERLLTLYGNSVEFSEKRDYFDYIYNRNDLEFLRGKKYHSKRNHLKNCGEYEYRAIDTENICDCYAINREWLDLKSLTADEGEFEEQRGEIAALQDGLDNFAELGFLGGIIYQNGKPTAYTFGERQNADTFTVHAEKALTGLYSAINNEFVRRLPTDIRYINREEDTGAENLRKAKMSYHPEYLLEKYTCRFV